VNSRILLVDDEPSILRGLQRVLSDDPSGWIVSTAGSVEAALAQLRRDAIDAVVTDVNMPHQDGFALLAEMRRLPEVKGIPVIVVTGLDEEDLKRRALEMGAIDLLNKPVHPQDLLARLRNAVRLKAYEDQLRTQNAVLECKVAERTADLANSRLDIIWKLGKAGEHRDEQTGQHVVRVGYYCRALAEKLGLARDFVEAVFLASPLHDIGKIGIPDRVLRKRGPLTPDEWEVMKQHCAIGADILREGSTTMRVHLLQSTSCPAPPGPPSPNPILDLAASIALTHHERWNGTGYPSGLAGAEIPLASRIVALADAYDALRSERPYKPALPEEETRRVVGGECGRQFDPEIYAAFERAQGDFAAVYNEFSDPAGQVAEAECTR
jgi:putative two-component system response regulator